MRPPAPAPRFVTAPFPVIALCVSLAALAACDSRGVRITTTTDGGSSKGVLKVVDALQCPDTMGSLTRKGSAQADGTVCTYTGPRGAEVSLHLVTLADEPAETVLARFERLLMADMPQAAAQMTAAKADDARAQAEAARLDADQAGADADAARAEADAARSAGDSAHISGPGVRIDAEGDRARVSLPGIHVDADGDKANVRIGGFTIRANDGAASGSGSGVNGTVSAGDGQESVSFQATDGGAEIRARAPGEATRQTWLLTDDNASDGGWRTVGYEARGPRGGPVVVATVRARERRANSVFDDAKDLVALNVGD
jgi:hypothetical protein